MVSDGRKESILATRYFIATEFNVTQADVGRIIQRYIELCKEDLIAGYIVRIFGLVTIVPDTPVSNFIASTALYSKRIAEELPIPYHSVLGVLTRYLAGLKDDLLHGKDVTLRSLVSLYALRCEGTIRVRSSVSESIKRDILNQSTVVSSIRSHTDKLLKEYVLVSTSSREV